VEFLQRNIKICGWIRHIRVHSSKNFAFLEVNDGSTVMHMQVIVDCLVSNFSEITNEILGASIEVKGRLVKSKGEKQIVILVENIKFNFISFLLKLIFNLDRIISKGLYQPLL